MSIVLDCRIQHERRQHQGGALVTAAALGAITLALGAGCENRATVSPPPETADAASPMMMPGAGMMVLTKPTLKPGDELPELEAEGWIGGVGETKRLPVGEVMLVDIWAKWCPYSDLTAPALVELYAKYRDQNVAFVSLSYDDEIVVKQFVSQHKITWPTAFKASLETIDAFGARNPMPPAPGYEVLPTFYVFGRDGRVSYYDGQARYGHQDAEKISEALSQAIEVALSKGTPQPEDSEDDNQQDSEPVAEAGVSN